MLVEQHHQDITEKPAVLLQQQKEVLPQLIPLRIPGELRQQQAQKQKHQNQEVLIEAAIPDKVLHKEQPGSALLIPGRNQVPLQQGVQTREEQVQLLQVLQEAGLTQNRLHPEEAALHQGVQM